MLTTPYPHVRGWEAWPWYWRFFRDPLLCLIELHRQFGPLGIIENPLPGPRRGHRYLLVTGESFNRQVLNRPDDFLPSGQLAKGPPGSAQRRVRRGILKMHGEEHRRHRRLMQPPFSKASVATTIRLMAPLIDEIIDQWQPGKPIDMFREMRVLSNWVAANVLFGNEDIAASLHIGDLIDRWIVLEARTRRWGMIERDLPGLPYRTELRHAERLEDTIRKMLEQKRVAGLSGEDVLSVLLRAADSREAGMKDADLIAHSVSLYGASFETTAGALAWTLFLIAQHPLCAARLHDEVSQLEEWPPDGPTLESLPFLDAVVRESLRLMPSVPFTFRRPARPLEFAGVPLRLGDKVVVSQFLTNRDPDVFPDPYRFDPSRWFGPRPTPYQYIPFNAGPRMCLGAGFATAEIKLVVARIMRKYRLTVVPQARIDATVHLVLKPRSGLPMNAHPQDRAFQRSPVRGNILQLIDLVSPEQEPSGDSVLSAA